MTATGVRICDRLPRGVALVRAPGASRRGRQVCWKRSLLRRGVRRTFWIKVRATTVAKTRTVTNSATARAANAPATTARARVRVLGPRRRPAFTG